MNHLGARPPGGHRAWLSPSAGAIQRIRRVIALICLIVAASAACDGPSEPWSEPGWTPTIPLATPTSILPSRPPSDCPHVPMGGFNDVWRNEQVYPRLGRAVAPAESVTGTEAYLCDGTHTLWLSEKRLFAVIPIWPHPWHFVADESRLPDDVPLMEGPDHPPEPCFPASGRHGWLAQVLTPENTNGPWARSSETAFSGVIQGFEGGWLLWNGNVCFVLFEDGSWTMF